MTNASSTMASQDRSVLGMTEAEEALLRIHLS